VAYAGQGAADNKMKLAILDRDGVINHDSLAYIKTPDEWRPIAGSLEAIARLNQAGYHVVVATNQAGVGRGLIPITVLNAIHDKLHRALAQCGGRLDAIFFCPHAADAGCNCRKPLPGMLEEIGHRFNTILRDVPVVGDSLRDLQAAVAVDARPLLVLTGKGRQTVEDGNLPAGTTVYADLAAAVAALTR